MKSSSKIILVIAGYCVALLIAFLVTSIYIAVTNGPDRQTYGSMYAFGDSILCLAIFGVASIPASAMTLFFLRPHPTFWRIVSNGALLIAATSVGTLAVYLMRPTADTFLYVWAEASPLRFFLAPLLAIAFFLCILFAPTRASRFALLCASVTETIVFVWVALLWFRPIS
ncbi:MAG TPA: hypothetical protein VFD70_06785 [Anaerolineae bacterium]|nr:hypothetical protein [Anaerolineae bacterium]